MQSVAGFSLPQGPDLISGGSRKLAQAAGELRKEGDARYALFAATNLDAVSEAGAKALDSLSA